MRIIRAVHLGMCFGVRDAIALAVEHAGAGPLTILGDLVHNPTVLSALEAKGIAFAQDVAQVQTPTLMVTAHGTSERNLARSRALGLTVVEATCPLVHVAHRAVAALSRDGYHVVIVGQRDHVELLNRLLELMTPGGNIFFSTNFRRFKLAEGEIRGATIREISRQTVPADFRNKRIHRSWRMVRVP